VRPRHTRLDLFQQQDMLLAARNQPRGRCFQNLERVFHFFGEGWNARLARGIFRSQQGRTRSSRLQAPNGDAGNGQFVGRPQWRWKHCRVERGEQTLRLAEMADQKQATNFDVARMRGVQPVPMRLEHSPRTCQRSDRPGKVARDERDLGLGDDAARPRHRLPWTEGTGSHLEECSGTDEIAKLCHGNTSQRQRRGVVAEGNPFQGAKQIAGRQGRAAADIIESIEIPSHLSLPLPADPKLVCCCPPSQRSRQ
jgi:hypothetical protein